MEYDHCRNYEKFLEFSLITAKRQNFATMEKSCGENERACIYELAISQEALDMPEVLWKSYIDF